MSANLPEIWHSSDYYKKQMFQYTLFPKGLAFDSKINDYRTPVVNSVFALNAELSNDWSQNKKRTSLFLGEKSDLVPRHGIEP